jgi:hypothetical protein
MIRRILSAVLGLLVSVSASTAQGVPTPRESLGFDIGADRKLADWHQLTSYYEKLAETSQRVTLDTLGTTTMGRPFVMLTVTSAANQAHIGELHAIQMKLSDPRTVSGPAELDSLIARGRTVVLMTHGIHATEVGGSQMAARLLWKLASSNDPSVRQILDNVILLDIPSLNPDGLQWVVDYYRKYLGTPYEGSPLPWLYQFYVGHDNNRDWYAFTQKETRLAVVKAHNAWHPEIVHDIHQMGPTQARIFFPPYIDPWEPNVDPALIAGVNQLGAYMAAEVTAEGKAGAVIDGVYDAFTPARAYQHYHGGVRILSETASARIATPVDIPADHVRGGRNYDASTASWNYPLPWRGGTWGLPDIVDYMEAGAMALLTNAAHNRTYWLRNFWGVNERAVEKWESWPEAWVIPSGQRNSTGVTYLLRILTTGDVEVHVATSAFDADGIHFPAGSWVIPMHQPYASFAQTLLDVQHYPDLRQYPGGPPRRPYDVTAQTLPYLMNVDAVAVEDSVTAPLSTPIAVPEWDFRLPRALTRPSAPRVAVYKSFQEPIEAGWTRWLFDRYGLKYDTLHSSDIRRSGLGDRYDVLVLQSQTPRSIIDGYTPGEVPPQYAGGIGAEGVAAVEDFVRAGGRLVAIEDAADFAAETFHLGVTNEVDGLASRDFYIPGSILRLELAPSSDLTRGMDTESIAWFGTGGRAFGVTDSAIRVVARYGDGDPLLSGWALGSGHVAGKPAIVEADVGKGSVVLFGFQPNYRGQSVTTWPLLFNALAR